MALNVMVLESQQGAADAAVHELTEAGHVVLRCHDPGVAAFPCRGLADHAACPLRSHVVDLALTVRSHPQSQPAPMEDGVRCAIMHRVPVIVAGPVVLDPYAEFEARVLDRTDDVVGACEEVAAAVLTRHTAVATDALRAAPTGVEELAAADAIVTRRNGRLLMSVSGLDALAPRRVDAAIVRAMGKLREFDPSARGVDVVLVRGGESVTDGTQERSAANGARHSM